MVTRASLPDTLRRLGLERLGATLSALARPAIRMRSELCAGDDVPLGGSKLGGRPDLPAGVEWPRLGDEPLSFIAQFDCRELQRFEAGTLLPPDGVLSFFYDAEQQPWGYDPRDAGAARVLYHPASAGLSRRTHPPEITAHFRTKRVELHEILEFPSHNMYRAADSLREYWDPSKAGFDVEPDEIERLTDLFDPGFGSGEHQLFGYPSVIQDPMELECELVSHGINAGTTYPPEAVARWGARAAAWRLLLQIDSEHDMLWGDMGIIYFWITDDALRTREFDRAWLILQC
jgi:uncharacterized protein YwqG